MKKVLSIVFFSLVIVALSYVGRFRLPETSLYILVDIYVVFPIIFIIQGVICSNSKKYMIISFLLLSISVMLPISIWYKMNSIIIPLINYLLLGAISAHLKNNLLKIKNKRDDN